MLEGLSFFDHCVRGLLASPSPEQTDRIYAPSTVSLQRPRVTGMMPGFHARAAAPRTVAQLTTLLFTASRVVGTPAPLATRAFQCVQDVHFDDGTPGNTPFKTLRSTPLDVCKRACREDSRCLSIEAASFAAMTGMSTCHLYNRTTGYTPKAKSSVTLQVCALVQLAPSTPSAVAANASATTATDPTATATAATTARATYCRGLVDDPTCVKLTADWCGRVLLDVNIQEACPNMCGCLAAKGTTTAAAGNSTSTRTHTHTRPAANATAPPTRNAATTVPVGVPMGVSTTRNASSDGLPSAGSGPNGTCVDVGKDCDILGAAFCGHPLMPEMKAVCPQTCNTCPEGSTAVTSTPARATTMAPTLPANTAARPNTTGGAASTPPPPQTAAATALAAATTAGAGLVGAGVLSSAPPTLSTQAVGTPRPTTLAPINTTAGPEGSVDGGTAVGSPSTTHRAAEGALGDVTAGAASTSTTAASNDSSVGMGTVIGVVAGALCLLLCACAGARRVSTDGRRAEERDKKMEDELRRTVVMHTNEVFDALAAHGAVGVVEEVPDTPNPPPSPFGAVSFGGLGDNLYAEVGSLPRAGAATTTPSVDYLLLAHANRPNVYHDIGEEAAAAHTGDEKGGPDAAAGGAHYLLPDAKQPAVYAHTDEGSVGEAGYLVPAAVQPTPAIYHDVGPAAAHKGSSSAEYLLPNVGQSAMYHGIDEVPDDGAGETAGGTPASPLYAEVNAPAPGVATSVEYLVPDDSQPSFYDARLTADQVYSDVTDSQLTAAPTAADGG